MTIAAVPVASDEASSMGIMRVDDSGRVVGFLEKPQTDEELDLVRTDPAWLDAHGIASRGRDCLASMGIYLFNRAHAAGRPGEDALPRFRQGGLSRLDAHPPRAGPPVRRLLGGHRHDQVVLRGQPGLGDGRSRSSTWPSPTRRSTAAPASCRPRGSTGPRSAAAWSPTAARSKRAP